MADYIVKDTELTSVANAIRTAGGTSSLLSFPNGFVSAVNNISGGGGSSSSDFRIVTATFITNSLGNVTIDDIICIMQDELSCGATAIGTGASTDVQVVLYKNNPSLSAIDTSTFGADAEIIVTGDAEYDDEYGDLTIYGDCTITINNGYSAGPGDEPIS